MGFSRRIRRAPFPQHFRPPANITKYTGETNPGIWLEDFRLAYRAGGVDDDYFIIQYLPICVGDMFVHGLNSSRTTASATGRISRGFFVRNF